MNEQGYRKELKKFEGYERHMYLDDGHVKIGFGIVFASAKSAVSSGIPFTNRYTKADATPEDVEADYELAKKGKKTNLDGDESTLKRKLDERLTKAKKDAKTFYADINQLPSTVQFALIDIAFTSESGGLANFRDLKSSLENKNWEEAAKQSNRANVDTSRNKAISDWILAGAGEGKSLDKLPPKSFFTSATLNKHFYVGNVLPKKRAETIFQKRFERDKVEISTMVRLSDNELRQLAREIIARQEEFARAKKPLYTTREKYDVYSRGGDQPADSNAVSLAKSPFQYGVKPSKQTDGSSIYIVNHVVNA